MGIAGKKILVAGHKGMVGSAIVRKLAGFKGASVIPFGREQADLTNQQEVSACIKKLKPDIVVLAAAKVGGIFANNEYPAEFIYQNLMIETNIIHSSYLAGVKELLFLGSSCIYPKFAEQPIKESELLTGMLEPTNEPYAIAKIAGIKMCESYNRQYGVDYRSAMPTNLYGTNDNFHPENSHVIPGLMRRFHESKVADAAEVAVWGSGKVRREFLHVDDMADACLHIMGASKEAYAGVTEPMLSHLNIGYGDDVTIRELALTIAEVVGYQGKVSFDASKPEGTPRKLMDSQKINQLGWAPKIDLTSGLKATYEWFLENAEDVRS